MGAHAHSTGFLLILILQLFGVAPLCGQEAQSYSFDRLNLDDGLISPWSTDLLEDEEGFLWIATSSGLSQYDGTSFINHGYSELPCGLKYDHIVALELGPAGRIFATDKAGWSVYDAARNCFEHYAMPDTFGLSSSQIMHALPDTGGIVWLAGGFGLCRYNSNTDLIQHFPTPSYPEYKLTAGREIRRLRYDPSDGDKLIVAMNGGICRFDKATLTYSFDIPWPVNAPRQWVNANSLYAFNDSTIWYGTWGNGMMEYDRMARTWTSHVSNEGKRFLDPDGRRVPWEVASGVLPIDGSTAWIGLRRGLGILDRHTGDMRVIRTDESDPRSLSSAVVGKIVRMRSGDIYIGSDNGLNVYKRSTERLERIDPLQKLAGLKRKWDSISENENKLYFCARILEGNTLLYSDAIIGGVTHFDVENRTFSHVPVDNSEGRPLVFYHARRRASGEILLTSDSKVFVYDPEHRHLSEFNSAFNDSIRSLRMYRPDLVCLPSGDVIAWNYRQLVGVNSSGDIQIYEIDDRSEDHYGAVVVTPEGLILWKGNKAFILENGGFRKLHSSDGPEARVTSAVFFANDLIYVGTAGTGLFHYKLERDTLKRVRRVTTQDGLPSNNITQLAADSNGNIWGSTFSGMFRLFLLSGKIRPYNIRDGVASPFIDEPATALPDGSVLFDDRRYLYHWHPPGYPGYVGKAYISSIEFGDSVYTDLDELPQLRPGQNSVFINMGIIDHQYGPRDKLKYRLEGFDAEWQEAGGDRTARYTNLDPGTYTLQARSVNPDGFTSDIAKVTFVVQPALYQRTWFVPGLILLGLLLVYIFYRNRIDAAKRRERQALEHNKRVAELELKALRSQMNPHFMFNSLNSIKNYILKSEPAKAAEYLSSFAHLIRLTLQNSRERTISLRQEIESLLLYIDLERLRFREGFQLNCSIDESIDMDGVEVPPLILQPYVENAIWHGLLHKEGERQLDLLFSLSNGSLKCVVDDNGIGREAAEKIKSKSATRYKSMGMGITRDRIDILNQLDELGIELDVTDKVDEEGLPAGTCVIINIPYARNSDR